MKIISYIWAKEKIQYIMGGECDSAVAKSVAFCNLQK